jgi:predicted O-methyltransferase YrrM
MFDGTRTHLMHNPEELSDFICFLKNYEKKNGKKIHNFLEIGFSAGKVNTVLNKFFNFEQIVAVDNFTADISATDLMANLRRKNLTLICGNSDKKEILRIIKKFQPFDLIFVDASHEYNNTKKDLKNYCAMLSDHGILAAHDIHSLEYPGVNKAWNEFKLQNNFTFKEIVCKKYYFVCGIGLAIKES